MRGLRGGVPSRLFLVLVHPLKDARDRLENAVALVEGSGSIDLADVDELSHDDHKRAIRHGGLLGLGASCLVEVPVRVRRVSESVIPNTGRQSTSAPTPPTISIAT